MKKIMVFIISISLLLTTAFTAGVSANETYYLKFDPYNCDFSISENGMSGFHYTSNECNYYRANDIKVGNSVTFTTKDEIEAGEYKVSIYARTLTSGRAVFNLTMCGKTTVFDSNTDYEVSKKMALFDSVKVAESDEVAVSLTATREGIVIIEKLLLEPIGENVTTNTVKKDIQYYKNNMRLDWSDEFDGDSLNTDTWNYQPETKHRNREETCFEKENVEVKDGNLVLVDKKETVTCGCVNMTEEQHVSKYKHSKTYNYTTGGIDSQGKIHKKMGMIETRFKCSDGAGTWPAVWMCGVDETGAAHWPFTGEIDIMEYVGQSPRSQFSSLHYTPDSYYDGVTSYTKKSAGGKSYTLPNNQRYCDDFHTIGIMWTEKHIDFYIDDYVYQSVDITNEEFYAFRDYDFYFLITFPLGGVLGKTIDDSALPQKFYVDYIRCYQPYDVESEAVTSNSVTLKQREGYQYSLDGRKWQDSNIFTELDNDTEYTFYQRIKPTSVFSGGSNKKVISLKTEKASNEEPTTISTTNPTIAPTTLAPVTPVKIKLSKPEITVKAGKKQFTVSYKKVKNAKKYKIYYRLKTAKKWKTITLKGTKKTIKKLKKGKKYQVKVRAINGKVKSKFSKVKTVKVK